MSKNVKKTNKPKTNNTRSAAAKGYVKETKKVEVKEVKETPKKKTEVKEAVKTLVREEEPKKVTKTKKACDFKKYLTTKNICIAIASLVVVILAIILIVNCTNQEKKLEKYMEELGKVYYEEIYQPSFSSDAKKEELLSKFTVTGINTDLENLVRAVSSRNDLPTDEEILAKFVNKKTGKSCDKTSTRIYFYPTEPYGAKDYTIKVKLDCGFDEK